MTPIEAADYIQGFLDGTGNEWDWDDFMHISIADRRVEEIRDICHDMPRCYPSLKRTEYCGAKGVTIMRGLIRELRAME